MNSKRRPGGERTKVLFRISVRITSLATSPNGRTSRMRPRFKQDKPSANDATGFRLAMAQRRLGGQRRSGRAQLKVVLPSAPRMSRRYFSRSSRSRRFPKHRPASSVSARSITPIRYEFVAARASLARALKRSSSFARKASLFRSAAKPRIT
jgi:hypothetical protein